MAETMCDILIRLTAYALIVVLNGLYDVQQTSCRLSRINALRCISTHLQRLILLRDNCRLLRNNADGDMTGSQVEPCGPNKRTAVGQLTPCRKISQLCELSRTVWNFF